MQKLHVPLLPFLLTAGIIIADQITKAVIVATIDFRSIGATVFGDFIRIVHARNLGMAFSIGNSLPDTVRGVLFVILPAIVMVVVLVYYVVSIELTMGMRWALAGIVGGGVGNLIDRVFRPLGVVDFIDVKVYGFLGFQRWPVFNVADSSVVVSGITLIVLFAIYEHTQQKKHRVAGEASATESE